jgi:hypothetical protein
MKEIEEMNVHEVHLFLCHKIDKQKLKAKIFKQSSNTIEL